MSDNAVKLESLGARVLVGDAIAMLRTLPDASVQCCVTSPPYWGLRDYGVAGQLGLEQTPEEYVVRMVEVFREVRRVLHDDGTLWLNLGDSYASDIKTGGRNDTVAMYGPDSQQLAKKQSVRDTHGLKQKDLVGIPWRVAFALQADGWYLRSDIIWAKPNPMPESVTDRPTKAHEYLFLLTKAERYFYDADAVRERGSGSHPRGNNATFCAARAINGNPEIVDNPFGRNRRTVWTIASEPFEGAHFATFPLTLAKTCILAGCPEDGMVLDPFAGASTTGVAALRLARYFTGIELNPEYAELGRKRMLGQRVVDKPKVKRLHLKTAVGKRLAAQARLL